MLFACDLFHYSIWFLLVQDNRQYEDRVRLECSCVLITTALYSFSIILMWNATVLLCSSNVKGGGGGGGSLILGIRGRVAQLGLSFSARDSRTRYHFMADIRISLRNTGG